MGIRSASVIPLLIALSLAGAIAQGRTVPEERETVLEAGVHIEGELVLDLPAVERLCEEMGYEGRRIRAGDCTLYCERRGRGTPLVLINGGPGGTHHYFHPRFARAETFADVVYYDQRGCGLSEFRPGAGYTVGQAATDLENLREALGIDRWIVLGCSYGGFLAQFYATEYPDSVLGLVLVGSSTGLHVPMGASRQYEFITPVERRKIVEIHRNPSLTTEQSVFNAHLNGDWKRQSFHKPTREELARMARYEWKHDGNFNSLMNRSLREVDLKGLFETCPIPTLIVEGEWDLTWNSEKPKILHGNHPGARLVLFKRSGHSPFEDEPDRFFSVLESFVRRLPKISKRKRAAWKKELVRLAEERERSPEQFLKSCRWGKKSNRRIAARYSEDWLALLGSGSLLKTGFALYDVKRYDEALRVFEAMTGKSKGNRTFEAMSLVWQGHMLDLLGKRKAAIAVYEKVAAMDLGNRIQHDQFGMVYAPSPYAEKRIGKPFKRIENRSDD